MAVKPYAPTIANLKIYALEPAFRWLVAVALDGGAMTYGELKTKLENEAGFSKIFPTHIGRVAGSLMKKIQKSVPDAPLINVLVVNQADRQPSEGAGEFMAQRFGQTKLAQKQAKRRYPQIWENFFKRAAEEVYKYSATEWADLYEKVFTAPLAINQIEKQREERKQGTEKDGIQTGRKYGAGGEGKFHRELRLWIKDHPKDVDKSFDGAKTETESDLDSGDRVDVVYKCAACIVLLEVKSRISNEVDLKRGVYQCIKYRAVRAAMDVRDNPLIKVYLVTETKLPGNIDALCRLHNIMHFQAPMVRPTADGALKLNTELTDTPTMS